MRKQLYPHQSQNRLHSWLGMLLLLGVFVLAACSQSQPTASTSADTASAPAAADSQPVAAAQTSTAIVKLDLNTATGEQFQTIPDVGSRMVREFNEYRPYASILQFRQEIGKYVDDAQVAAYEAYLFVPIDPNSSDAATVQQIPGVDEALAAGLIAARPYASHAAFVEKLAETLTPEQVAVAESYLVGE